MDHIDALVAKLSAFLAGCAAIFTITIMFVMVGDIINRALGNGSIGGAYELVVLLMLMIVFLGIAYAERTEVNVRVRLATSRMPPKAAQITRALGGVVSFLVVALFAKTTWSTALTSIERGEFTQGLVSFPVWPSKLVIAVGFSLLAVECLLAIRRRWLLVGDSSGQGSDLNFELGKRHR